MNEQIDRHFEWIAENPRYGYLIAGGILLLWLTGGNGPTSRTGGDGIGCATLSAKRRCVSVWAHCWSSPWQVWRAFILPRRRKRKTECLMRKQEYKEQERPRRYYFFDYLFWLGEMAQQHYKGEPRRPDGDRADNYHRLMFRPSCTRFPCNRHDCWL